MKTGGIQNLFLACLLLVFAGCASTVVPEKVHDQEASWDGNQKNSGFIQFNADGSGLITARARERYNALIEVYGNRFAVPLREDAGIKPANESGLFIIDAEHLVKFATMNRWRKEGQ